MHKISKENYFELAVFLTHYHNGQWSRWYRLLSRLGLTNLSSRAEQEATESFWEGLRIWLTFIKLILGVMIAANG
jgi:hypothetical protein